jgi:ABC-type multidrug transport system ATPase subunit
VYVCVCVCVCVCVRVQMGVCPQFDILWNELTGNEHLSIYAHVKGLPRRKVRVCVCV